MKDEATTIFRNIQSLCKAKSISVSALEESAGLPGGTIPNWSKERHWMVYLQSVAKTLQVSIDQLFLEDPTLFPSTNEDVHTRQLRILNAMEDLDLSDTSVEVMIEVAKLLQRSYSETKRE